MKFASISKLKVLTLNQNTIITAQNVIIININEVAVCP